MAGCRDLQTSSERYSISLNTFTSPPKAVAGEFFDTCTLPPPIIPCIICLSYLPNHHNIITIIMKGYTLFSIAVAASQQLAQVNFAYAKLESGSSIRRLLPEESIVDHVLITESSSNTNTHFIIAAENEDGADHPDILVRLSEDAVTEDTLISYDDDSSSRRRGSSSRRILVSAEADTFAAISVHTDGNVRGIVQKKGEASKNIVQ